MLTKPSRAAYDITMDSTVLQRLFGGTLVPHGCVTELFDPAAIDGESARRTLGFTGPTVLFPGTPRSHKGLEPLAQAVARVPGARIAVPCRSNDLAGPEWGRVTLDRIPMTSYCSLRIMLAA